MSTYLTPQEYAKDVKPRFRQAEFTTKQTEALTRAPTFQYQILTEMNARIGGVDGRLDGIETKLGMLIEKLGNTE